MKKTKPVPKPKAWDKIDNLHDIIMNLCTKIRRAKKNHDALWYNHYLIRNDPAYAVVATNPGRIRHTMYDINKAIAGSEIPLVMEHGDGRLQRHAYFTVPRYRYVETLNLLLDYYTRKLQKVMGEYYKEMMTGMAIITAINGHLTGVGRSPVVQPPPLETEMNYGV